METTSGLGFTNLWRTGIAFTVLWRTDIGLAVLWLTYIRFTVLWRTESRPIRPSDPGNINPVNLTTQQHSSIPVSLTEQQYTRHNQQPTEQHTSNPNTQKRQHKGETLSRYLSQSDARFPSQNLPAFCFPFFLLSMFLLPFSPSPCRLPRSFFDAGPPPSRPPVHPFAR